MDSYIYCGFGGKSHADTASKETSVFLHEKAFLSLFSRLKTLFESSSQSLFESFYVFRTASNIFLLQIHLARVR